MVRILLTDVIFEFSSRQKGGDANNLNDFLVCKKKVVQSQNIISGDFFEFNSGRGGEFLKLCSVKVIHFENISKTFEKLWKFYSETFFKLS